MYSKLLSVNSRISHLLSRNWEQQADVDVYSGMTNERISTTHRPERQRKSAFWKLKQISYEPEQGLYLQLSLFPIQLNPR